jgi:uncharacterized repeat protein (TIGR01451 family)
MEIGFGFPLADPWFRQGTSRAGKPLIKQREKTYTGLKYIVNILFRRADKEQWKAPARGEEYLCAEGETMRCGTGRKNHAREGTTMKGNRRVLYAAMLAAAALHLVGAANALAADPAKPVLALTLTAQKEATVKDAEGKTKVVWQEATDVKPGDVLKFTIAYKNTGPAEARDGLVTDPVPKDTAYISGSAEGKDAEITFSLDGKTFQSPPQLKYKVRQADGTDAEYQATPEMYTHIQWKLLKPVPPGGAGSLSFRAKVR